MDAARSLEECLSGPENLSLACMVTGLHRESGFRVGGSTLCLDCGMKLATCCEGAPQS